jgi:hypothetical protein
MSAETDWSFGAVKQPAAKPDSLECSHQNPVLILNSKGLVI